MQYKKYIPLLALVLSFILFVSNLTFVVSAADLNDVQDLNTRVKTVQIQQNNESEIKEEIQKRTEENATLEKLLLELKETQVQIETELSLENSSLQPDTDNITTLTTQLDEIKENITQTEASIEGNKTYISEGENTIQEKKEEIQNELFVIQDEVLDAAQTYAMYGVILIASYIFFRFSRRYIDKNIKHHQWKKWLRIATNTLFITILSIFILIITAGNITAIITSFGFVSAALVVVLQDFISSLFAYIYIKAQNLYREGDVVSIPIKNNNHAGIVDSIGPFRTTIKELEDTNGLNSERQTGREISLPNNVILSDSITNYTKEHKILWHSFTVTVTFETDMMTAKDATQHAITTVFNEMMEHKGMWFDSIPKLKHQFEPRLYMTLADSGYQFHIWFACRYGKFTQAIDQYSTQIYKVYSQRHITLAYNTQRILVDKNL